MSRYRFITPNRTGKWYPDLETAKQFAAEIGAGFLDSRTGRFVAYVGTKLEIGALHEEAGEALQPA
ncbi:MULTISPECIES: hypothetical protein [Novosphingobium]|nr:MULTISPECIES: hypothetical protein [unclassified Novosphingobium]KPH58830.1 hypothetical protein ADT71_26220 [Novosphingobium sp. ST904]MPS70776.1 hypothetical protein [Novosphingobium sp.]